MATRPATALDVALRLLGQRAHFRAELERKLARKGFLPEEIESALARVAELGQLDDEGLAGREVERLRERKGLGRAAVAAELRRKGAAADALDAALADGSSTHELELGRAREAAAKWLRTRRPDPAALGRHLDRKGYARSIVYAVVAELLPAADASDGGDDEDRGTAPVEDE